jgi:hypothetical protein
MLVDPEYMESAVDRIAPGRSREFVAHTTVGTQLNAIDLTRLRWIGIGASGRYVDRSDISSDALQVHGQW